MADTDTTPRWSAKLLELGRRCGTIPVYASGEWHELPSTDPRRFAAVVRAAEAWRQDGQPEAVEARLRAELGEADRLAVKRTRRAWAEFEDAWREFRQGRRHVVSAKVLAERRRIEPLPAEHPLARRDPWPPESLTCPINMVRPATSREHTSGAAPRGEGGFAGIPAATPCGPDCCRRLKRREVA